MATLIEPLAETERDSLFNSPPFNEGGACLELALALHEGLGWQLMQIETDGAIRQCCVQQPDGVLFDLLRPMEPENLEVRFGPDHFVRAVAADWVKREYEVSTDAIAQAHWWAWCVRPDLPWQSDPSQQYADFAAELDQLCRKHGVYLRASLTTQPMVVAPLNGGELGFTICPTPNSVRPSFTIERRLEGGNS